MAWKFVEGLTVADVAFSAKSKTLEGLFADCGQATTATMVKDVSSVKPTKTKKLSLSAGSQEQLLHDFLERLVFLKDAELLLLSKYDVKVKQSKGGFGLKATLKGEKLDPKKHELVVDVKAVTWHKFELKQAKNGSWSATVVLDI